MEFDQNFMLDYVFALAPILLILITCLTICYGLRFRWPLKVNCWFCNNNTKIWKQDLDWWLCPSCKQYNGFSKDGDYTYDIPEQYEMSNKSPIYCKSPKQNDTVNLSKNSFCMDCLEHESLKLLEISNFEPKRQNFYNMELKAFKEYLEERYPLCTKCKSMVQSTLNKQMLWLTRYKMLFFRHKSIRAVCSNMKRFETIFQAISIILAPVVAYNHNIMWLPIAGLLFHLCACWTNSMKKSSDLLLILLWCTITVFVYRENSTMLQEVWLIDEHIQYHMIRIWALFIVFVSVLPDSYKNTLTGPVTFKKLKWRAQNAVRSESVYYNQNENDFNHTSSSIESSISTNLEPFSTKIKSYPVASKQKLCTPITNNIYVDSIPSNKSSPSDCYRLNDSLKVLSSLSLSEDPPKYSPKMPSMFERKIYTTANCDLFRRSSGASNRRCVLSPPKLRSVTQTSWVAGGYWQDGMTSLSRSSSQSSGFGSAGSSNLAPSREPSVHEFDRCSVMSDATQQSCHTLRPTLTNLTRPSSIPRAQSRFSTYDSTMTTDNYTQTLSPSVVRARNAIATENRAQEHIESLVENRNDSIPVCSSHTTIVTSSYWLSVLLCGSLILNMIVLCAMLQR